MSVLLLVATLIPMDSRPAAAAHTTAAANTAPATAAAMTTCRITPGSTTLYTRSRNVEFDVPSARWWTLRASDINLAVYDIAGRSGAIVQFDPRAFVNRDAGTHAVKVERQNGENIDTCSAALRLRRGTALALKVRRTSRGRELSGRLRHVNFGSGHSAWSPYARQRIAVQYRATPGSWRTITTATTRKDGTWTARVTAGRHRWRAVYRGSATNGPRRSASVVR